MAASSSSSLFPKLIQTSTQRFFGIVGHGPFDTCGPLFDKLSEIVKKDLSELDEKLQRAMLVLCHVPTTDKADLEWAVAVLIPPLDENKETLQVPTGLKEILVPGRRCATTMYVGPYDGLPKAWGQLCMEWVPSQNLMPMKGSYDNVHYEVYVKWEGDSPETQLYCPVQEKPEGDNSGTMSEETAAQCSNK